MLTALQSPEGGVIAHSSRRIAIASVPGGQQTPGVMLSAVAASESPPLAFPAAQQTPGVIPSAQRPAGIAAASIPSSQQTPGVMLSAAGNRPIAAADVPNGQQTAGVILSGVADGLFLVPLPRDAARHAVEESLPVPLRLLSSSAATCQPASLREASTLRPDRQLLFPGCIARPTPRSAGAPAFWPLKH